MPVKYDKSTRSGIDHAYYLGEFLRMQHPQMKRAPFVGQSELQKGPDHACYDVTKEVQSQLKETHEEHAQFEITHLVHSTSLDNFLSIIKEGIIRAGEEKTIKGLDRNNPLKEESYRLSWWALSFNKQITNSYKTKMQSILFNSGIDYQSPTQKISLLNSSPFCQPSRYGNFRLNIPVKKLIEYYESSIGETAKYEFFGPTSFINAKLTTQSHNPSSSRKPKIL